MPQDNEDVAVIKSEDYTPGYLSTNTGFNPQTASFFYESGANTAEVATSSTSDAYTVAKAEPGENSYNVNIVKQVPTGVPPQHIQRSEYVSTQRQYQQHQLQRQQYYQQQAVLAQQQQREYLARREGTIPPHFVVTGTQPGIQYLPRSSVQEQMASAAHPTNMPYSMMQSVMQQRAQRNVAVQRVPMMVRPRLPAGIQPQFQYGPAQMNVKPGVQCNTSEMYMRYEGDVNVPSYSHYHQAEVPALGVNPFPVHQQNGVPPMPQAQMGYSQVPYEYPMHGSDYNNNMTFRDVLGTDAVDGESAVDGGIVKRRKRPRKVRTSDIMGEGEGDDGTPIRKRRTNKRKKLSSETEGAEASLADTNVLGDGPQPSLTHGELLKQKKKNMAFPKGTFLVRYADLDSDEYAGHIWLVDNHQLLQKYTYDGLDASNLKIFSRTERYSGWLCTCPWLYHPLSDVRGILGNMEKVCVRNHPTRDELFARREEESKKAPDPEPEQMDTAEEAVNSDTEHLCDEHEAIMGLPDDSLGELPLFKTEEPDIV